ncbi:MAG: diacylglycerol kinase family protein [Bacteroidales bacterium]|nr:diacylglycerol kinase family protein [Bacteroidales bacterium]
MKTFKHALNGIIYVFRKEQNFRIHVIATILAIIAGVLLSIEKNEWLMIIIAISFVIALEIVNSAIEYLCDFVSPEYNDKIKRIKDASASAVLVTAMGAFVLAIVIFLPKVVQLFSEIGV